MSQDFVYCLAYHVYVILHISLVYTVQHKGHSIVVSKPLGLVNDILQVRSRDSVKGKALVSPQYLFISPIAARTMQLGNIMGEW